MPDHFHALIWLDGEAVTSTPSFGHRVPGSLGAIVGGWKSACTSAIKEQRRAHDWPEIQLWQRNYHDHIVRDERELNLIREYIQTNPARWDEDEHW